MDTSNLQPITSPNSRQWPETCWLVALIGFVTLCAAYYTGHTTSSIVFLVIVSICFTFSLTVGYLRWYFSKAVVVLNTGFTVSRGAMKAMLQGETIDRVELFQANPMTIALKIQVKLLTVTPEEGNDNSTKD